MNYLSIFSFGTTIKFVGIKKDLKKSTCNINDSQVELTQLA